MLRLVGFFVAFALLARGAIPHGRASWRALTPAERVLYAFGAGNALLYSVASDDDDAVPRGLFVLTGDGQLTRVDELEPFPGRVTLASEAEQGVLGRFAAAGPS